MGLGDKHHTGKSLASLQLRDPMDSQAKFGLLDKNQINMTPFY